MIEEVEGAAGWGIEGCTEGEAWEALHRLAPTTFDMQSPFGHACKERGAHVTFALLLRGDSTEAVGDMLITAVHSSIDKGGLWGLLLIMLPALALRPTGSRPCSMPCACTTVPCYSCIHLHCHVYATKLPRLS